MFSPYITWEDLSDATDVTGNRWEDTYDRWDGDASITTTAIQLASDSNDLQFFYIKNTGSNAVIISLDGVSATKDPIGPSPLDTNPILILSLLHVKETTPSEFIVVKSINELISPSQIKTS